MSPITHDTRTAEQKVEEARQALNRRVEQLQRNNGITKHYDLSLGEAIDLIKALDHPPTRRPNFTPTRREMTPADREIIAQARWHDASKLSVYLNVMSEEFQRDLNKYGVYVLIELTPHGEEVPLFVEAAPKYVGMSTILSSRIRNHAAGGKNSNPADHVMLEFLLEHATEAEQAAYAIATVQEQRELRRLCMARRDLWVRTAHTIDRAAAFALEDAVTHQYRDQGYELWNLRP